MHDIQHTVADSKSSACLHACMQHDTTCIPQQALLFTAWALFTKSSALCLPACIHAACMTQHDATCTFVQVLVFSHSVRMLDIIERLVIMTGYVYLKLDGSTKQQDRQTQVDQFNNSASVFLFLISTTAGGLGLNLTSANRCDMLLVLD